MKMCQNLFLMKNLKIINNCLDSQSILGGCLFLSKFAVFRDEKGQKDNKTRFILQYTIHCYVFLGKPTAKRDARLHKMGENDN